MNVQAFRSILALAIFLSARLPRITATRQLPSAPPRASVDRPAPKLPLRMGIARRIRLQIGAIEYRFVIDLEGRSPRRNSVCSTSPARARTDGSDESPMGRSAPFSSCRSCGAASVRLESEKPLFKVTLQGAPRRGGLFRRGDGAHRLHAVAEDARTGIRMPFPWADHRVTRPLNAPWRCLTASCRSPNSVDSGLWTRTGWRACVIRWSGATPAHAEPDPQSLTGAGRRAAFEREARTVAEHVALPGHSFAAEDSVYHAGLEEVSRPRPGMTRWPAASWPPPPEPSCCAA